MSSAARCPHGFTEPEHIYSTEGDVALCSCPYFRPPTPLDAATLRAVRERATYSFYSGAFIHWIDQQLAAMPTAAAPRLVAQHEFVKLSDSPYVVCKHCRVRLDGVVPPTCARNWPLDAPPPVAEPEHARNDESETLVARLRYAEKVWRMAKFDPAVADDLREAADRLAAPVGWQPIETAPKDRLIIGALIYGSRIHRVSEMRHNGLAFYTTNGGALPQMTHWMPLPEVPHE